MNYRKLLIQVIVSFVAIISITYGRLISFPDAVHRLYGLPLQWGVHQLVSIAGTVDIWRVNLSYLALDLVIWFLILLVIPGIVSRKQVNQR